MTEKISVEDATNEYYRLKNLYETSYYEKYINLLLDRFSNALNAIFCLEDF